MKHYILSLAAVLASCSSIMAQTKPKSNGSQKVFVKVTYPPLMEQDKFLSLSVGGGISTYMFDVPGGASEFGLGGRANIDYNIFFSRNHGLSFGVGGSKINSSLTLNGTEYSTTLTYPGKDYMNNPMNYDSECYSKFTDWTEKQSSFALEVPIGYLLRLPISDKMTFLAGVGGKVTFPIKSNYEVTDGKVEKAAYIKDLDLHVENMPNHGLTVSEFRASGTTKTKFFSAGVYLDLNMVHKIGAIELFYGVYGDYGLTSVAKQELPLISTEEYNGVLISDVVESVVPFSAGLRVGIKIPCPRLKDQDGDGVIDNKDLCPNTPSGLPVDTCGCPLDTDGDGVYDYLDRCGATPKGVAVDTCGCPLDTDGDGVPDHLDKCPYTPKGTPVDSHGCPFDADGDGVPDHADKCPNTPEGVKVDQNGCPFDTDADGIPDYLDKCPTIPGIEANQGCPDVSEKARQAFKNAEQGIEFEPGTAVLIRSSCHYIDKIIAIMREYPNYRLVVNGHTDSSGSMAVNLKVSKRRAMAVVDYMVEHGIYPSRLRSFGHGGNQPIGDNKTLAGRKLNNRIEFKVEFDQ